MKLFAHDKDRGTSLVELAVTLSLIGVFGLSIYSMLNVGMIMGAKNGAVNTAHQQARVAMLQMVRDLHSAISLPALTDGNAVPLVNPAPNTSAAGISFQLWATGPSNLRRLGDWLLSYPDPAHTWIERSNGRRTNHCRDASDRRRHHGRHGTRRRQA